jgi:hypothetical protein
MKTEDLIIELKGKMINDKLGIELIGFFDDLDFFNGKYKNGAYQCKITGKSCKNFRIKKR